MKKHAPSVTGKLQSGGVFDCLYDEYFTLTGTDDSLYQFLGYTRESFNEQFHGHLLDVICPDDRELVLTEIKNQLSCSNVFMYENRMVSRTGELYWVWVSAEFQNDPVKGPLLHCAFHDITVEKQAQAQLAISEQRYEIVFAQMQDIIFELDCQTFEIYYSPNFEKKFGYSIPVHGFPDSMFETDIIFAEDKAPLRQKFQHILEGGASMHQEYRIKKLDGSYLWVEVHATAIRDASGRLQKILGIITDINSRKQELLEIRKAAVTDPLTSLFNRRECIRRIEEYIQQSGSLAAFLLIDVDNFKTINDMMGHAYGDSVLTELAAGLRTLFRQTDIIGRIGGDEFIVFMTNIRETENAVNKICGVLRLFNQYKNAPETCALSCSIGCSLYPDHGSTFSTLFQKADAAMYHAKKRGKAQYYIYEEGKVPSFGENGDILPVRTMQKSFHDHIIEYVFRFFLEHPENAIAIPLLLEQLGSIFHADRICIYEKTGSGMFHPSFLWTPSGSCSSQDYEPPVLPLSWTTPFHETVLTYPDVNQIEDAATRAWFLHRQTRSAIVCLLDGQDELLTAVLYEDCCQTRQGGDEERYTLFMISEIIHLFLSKERGGFRIRRQGDEQLAFLMDCIAGGMMGYYLEDGLPLYFINSRMLDFLGYRSQKDYALAVEGMISNSICAEDRSLFQNVICRQLETRNEYETEYRMIKENGDLIWVSSKGKKTVTTDGREAVVCLCVDISEQKEYENQLALYRKASSGGAFIARIDETFSLIYANDIFYDIYEITKEEMARRGSNCRSLIVPEDLPLVQHTLEDALHHHKPDFRCEIRVITGKGNRKWILINGTFEMQKDGLVMNGFVIDLTENHLLKDEIAHQELVYRTALKETHINVWEYDVKTHTLLLTESAEEHHAFSGRLEQVPQSLLDHGYIHPGSRQDLLQMYQQLNSGAAHVQADILTLSADHSSWWWERIRYTMIYDKDGNPDYAVAIGEDISEQKKAEMQYQQDLQLRMAFNDNLIASFRCNLSTNYTEYVEGESIPSGSSGMSYEELMAIHSRFVASQEDTLRIQKLMNREALLDSASRGNTMLSFEYRRKNLSGRLSWVCATIRLIQDARNGSLYAYGTLQDITEKKNMELAMKDRAERDMLTGVYNKGTAIQIISDAMKKSHQQKGSYALLVFNVDHFTQIVHDNGYMAADSILKEIADQLLMRFTKEKIIGRFYGDEFLVYIYNNPTPDLVNRYAEEVRKAIAMPYLFPDAKCPVSICAGIVFDNNPQSTFDSLYQKARLALIAAKASGRNNCRVYSEQLEQLRSQEEPAATMIPESRRQEYSHSGENILLKCMYSITSSTDFRDSLEKTLKELGRYYDGDRAYIIELEQKEQELRNIYEWKKEDVLSIRDTGSILLTPVKVSGQMHQRLKQLRYRDNIEDIKESNPVVYRSLKQFGIHSYYLATLDEKNFSIGYIGIDNPRRNLSDTSVLNALRYVLANELTKRRLQDKQQFLSYHDELTGVLNRNSFKEYCGNLSEEGLISMGIVSLDINGLKEINRVHGNSYGDDIVCCVARLLEEIFPFSRVYRFTGDEFLIVCENISRDSFYLRLRKLKNQSQDICSISVGNAWSDTDIHLDSLMHNADERRMIAKQTYYDDRKFDSRRWNGATRKDLLEKLNQNEFCIYLQPKIDSRDTRLYGAEALIRHQHPTEGLTLPMKFIPSLENAGLIHYIDFFVLHQVCETLHEWEEQGLPLIPVSLNFSRSTLLVDDLIARMEEIVSRHGTDKSYLEIEITESIGDVERSTIAEIGNQIRKAGYRIALDDFGAKYSNISFLSALQFHHLKLDKGLVNNLITNESARLIVKNIMNLCRELNIHVIAEGVESQEQLEILKELQCYYIQGYYYDKPVTVPRFVERYLE